MFKTYEWILQSLKMQHMHTDPGVYWKVLGFTEWSDLISANSSVFDFSSTVYKNIYTKLEH